MTDSNQNAKTTKEKLFRLFGRWENPIFEYDLTGIGKCRLCTMTVGDEIEIAKLNSKPREQQTPEELADMTLRFILRKSKDDKGPSLTEEEIKLIPQDLKEEMFEKLLAESSYLYREMNSTKTKGDDGVHRIEISEGDIIRPRNPDESAIQYYHRVKSIYDQEQSKKLKEQFKKLNFSTGLNSQILKSMQSLDQITSPLKDIEKFLNPLKGVEEALNRYRPVSDGFFLGDRLTGEIKSEPLELKTPLFDFKNLENPQLTTMRDIRDEIRGNHDHSVSVFAGISETLIQMLNELQGTTKDTTRALRIAIASLIVSIFIGGVQLYFEVKNNDVSELKIELQKSHDLQKSLIERIEQMNTQKIQQDELILKELKQLNKPK